VALRNILEAIKQRFHCLPEKDSRAKIGPLTFVAALVTCFTNNGRGRTIASLRNAVATATGTHLDRGTFWERLATDRLQELLTYLVVELMVEL